MRRAGGCQSSDAGLRGGALRNQLSRRSQLEKSTLKSDALRWTLLVAALFSLLCLLAATTPRAQAASVLINNGLAPPNPENVIDDDTVWVIVRNVGCPPSGDPTNSPCPSPGGPTSVSLLRGQSLISGTGLMIYDTSTSTIDGAALGGGLYAYDSSGVTMNDGFVGGNGIRASGSASVEVLGGRVVGLSTSRVSDTAVITLSGGSVRGVTAEDSSSVILAGGTVTGDSYVGAIVLARDFSSVVLNDGSISGISMRDFSNIVMSGGEVSGRLSVNHSSRADISGGTIDSLHLSSDSPASITGGVISSLEIVGGAPVSITGGTIGLLANYDATATLEGGTVSEMHVFSDYSTLSIRGSGFAVDGIPVPYGDLTPLTGTLTGTLASGDAISSAFTREDFFSPGTITLIPEPSTTLLLACGLAGLAAAGRQRSRH